MALSIEESINRLKAEVLAQDWRISPKRAEQLEDAFSCLRQRFKTRKATHAMLVMACSVLDHIKKSAGTPPETIDFIKEAMAHVVSLYEDLTYDPGKEDKIFKGLFRRFNSLKQIIRQNKSTVQTPPSPEMSAAAEDNTTDSPVPLPKPATAFNPDGSEEMAFADKETAPPLPSKLSDDLSSTEVTHLISNLQNSLKKVEEAENVISSLLNELQAAQRDTTPLPPAEKESPANEAPEATPEHEQEVSSEPETPAKIDSPPQEQPPKSIAACPPAELYIMIINKELIAIKSKYIAMSRDVSSSRLQSYCKNSSVPLKDFSFFMNNLSTQFKGNLSKIKSRKLKKLSLPIMIPQGMDLAETPDDNAQKLLFISNGNWHGAIACSEPETHTGVMVKYQKQFNGDISGVAHLEDESQVMIMDSLSILRREGFLLMG